MIKARDPVVTKPVTPAVTLVTKPPAVTKVVSSHVGIGRPRKYESVAAKQAAYRARKAAADG